MEKQQQSQFPARVEAFNGNHVSIHQIEDRDYLTAEEIGICLGLAQPRKSVNNIFNRNREELEPHTCVINMVTQGQKRATRLFDETGCNLITFFAQTTKAKAFRLWLAQLPKKVRQVEQCLPEVLEQARRQGMATGAYGTLALMESRAAMRLGAHRLNDLIWYRLMGLTQEETGKLLDITKDGIQEVERSLKDLGVVFKAVSKIRRKRQMRHALTDILAGQTP